MYIFVLNMLLCKGSGMKSPLTGIQLSLLGDYTKPSDHEIGMNGSRYMEK
jgi:hypothetical protein